MKCNHCYPLCQCGAEARDASGVGTRPPDAWHVQGVCTACGFNLGTGTGCMQCEAMWIPSSTERREVFMAAGVRALLRDAARFPELEAMERELANYGEGK